MPGQLRLLSLLVLSLLLTGCAITPRTAIFKVPDNKADRFFHKDTILPSPSTFQFAVAEDFSLPQTKDWIVPETDITFDSTRTLDQYLTDNGTEAFLVIRNDSILYERYYGEDNTVDEARLVWSVTKSIVSALTGIALEEGFIRSLTQSASDFIPEWANDTRREITIGDLLYMTSGLNYEDNSQMFNAIKAGYFLWHHNTDHVIAKTKLRYKPGTHWAYKSIDTQALGLVLERAIGRKLSDYAKEKLWDPMGLEYPAYWCLDEDTRREKFYGGMVITARDLAKFGRLYANDGNWNGQQLVPEAWVKSSRAQDSTAGHYWMHPRSWWLPGSNPNAKQQDFQAVGHQGQYCYVNPETNTIIIRQGRVYGKEIRWYFSFSQLAWRLGNKDYTAPLLKPLPEDLAGRVCGTYCDAEGRIAKIEYTDGQLFAIGKIDARQKKSRSRLYPQDDESFINVRDGLRTIVDYGKDQVKGLIMEVKGRPHYMRRVDNP